MTNKKPFTLADLGLMILVTSVLAALLLPVFIKARTLQANRCQSNMYRIGNAIHMYLSDWDYTYPTNRPWIAITNPPSLMNMTAYVKLSDPNRLDSNGEPIRFQYGISWVESLYPYIEKVQAGTNTSVWKCPVAREANGPAQMGYPGVTYAFNMNLVEYPKGVVKNVSKMMMIRELDRRYESVLRPSNVSHTGAVPPYDPFLGPEDKSILKNLNYRMHGEGSHILFADGHVKGYPTAYFSTSGQWDPITQQWWNYVSGVPADSPLKQKIAISP